MSLRAIVPAFLVALAACGPRMAGVGPVPDPAGVWDFRTVAMESGTDVSLAAIVSHASRADVLFFGEFHDDAETHRAEAELLAALARTGRPIVLSLEMFERDVQPVLDEYLAGRLSEAEFLARSRPWPRYATDYRTLVEMARTHGWPVVASNVPRPMASAVGRRGLAALDTLTPAERAHAAREIVCPRDTYHERFMQTMRGHGSGSSGAQQAGDSLPTAMAERFYLAQCVKDETMAESIVAARERAPADALVLHYNGAFHSDFGLGTAARVQRRRPEWRIVSLSAIPAGDPAAATLQEHRGRADYVIFTRRRTADRQ